MAIHFYIEENLNKKLIDHLLNKQNLKRFQKVILWQICDSNYDSGHALRGKFEVKVATIRRNIVHSEMLDIDKNILKEGIKVTFS